MEIKTRKIVRMITLILWGLFVATYMAAKLHFFTRYFQTDLGNYLREHSIYWIGLGAIAFVLWIIEKLFPEKNTNDLSGR